MTRKRTPDEIKYGKLKRLFYGPSSKIDPTLSLPDWVTRQELLNAMEEEILKRMSNK